MWGWWELWDSVQPGSHKEFDSFQVRRECWGPWGAVGTAGRWRLCPCSAFCALAAPFAPLRHPTDCTLASYLYSGKRQCWQPLKM